MAQSQGRIRIRRAYVEPGPDEGYRVLVDRLWPRGVRKAELELDEWAREVAPSPELREWFGHEPARWEEFRRRYRAELYSPERRRILASLADRARRGPVTLIFGARDEERNGAVVIGEVLEEVLDRLRRQAA